MKIAFVEPKTPFVNVYTAFIKHLPLMGPIYLGTILKNAGHDVVIYNANAPFAFRVLDSQLLLVTAVMSATAQLRDALAGSGNVVSGSFDTATAVGRVRDAGTAITAAPLIALGGTLALRRSDIGIAGEVIVEILKV